MSYEIFGPGRWAEGEGADVGEAGSGEKGIEGKDRLDVPEVHSGLLEADVKNKEKPLIQE